MPPKQSSEKLEALLDKAAVRWKENMKSKFITYPEKDWEPLLTMLGWLGKRVTNPCAFEPPSDYYRTHVNPICVQFYLNGKMGQSYIDEKREHVATCEPCQKTFDAYGIK